MKQKYNANETFDIDEWDITSAESKVTYEEIKDYVVENHGLQVKNLYIAQIERGNIILLSLSDGQKCRKPVLMRVSGICFLKWL